MPKKLPSEMRSSHTKRVTRRGTEPKGKFTQRLKKEERWADYIADREAVCKAQNLNTAAAHNVVYDNYAPEGENLPPQAPPPPSASTAKPASPDPEKPSIEEYYADKLPNGCPLFDEDIWKGKANTNLLDDVQWVASHLGLLQFDYVNRSPSLRACTLYWEARYTNVGMQRYQDLLKLLEVPDKATLKQLNNRKDDGAELNRLNQFMKNYDQHIKENQ